MTAIDGRVTRRPLRAGGLVWPLVALAAFLVLWQAVAAAVGSSSVVPGPLEVVRNFLANAGGSAMLGYLGLDVTSYAGNLGYTASVVLSGWAIGSVIGLVAGTAAARVQAVRNLVEPVTRIFGVVPVLVVAPFVLVWFGTSTGGKLALIAFFSAVTVCVIAQGSAL
ncbi:ABC transporter permease, partial [Alcanivoracaceae bacterium MT1]